MRLSLDAHLTQQPVAGDFLSAKFDCTDIASTTSAMFREDPWVCQYRLKPSE
jgi:hypothetical protein